MKSVYSILNCGFGKAKLAGSFPTPQTLPLSSGFAQNLNFSVDINEALSFLEGKWGTGQLSFNFTPIPDFHEHTSVALEMCPENCLCTCARKGCLCHA